MDGAEEQFVAGRALEVEVGVVLPGEADAAVQLDGLGRGGAQRFQGLGEGEAARPLPLPEPAAQAA